MNDELNQFIQSVEALISNLDSAARRRLLRTLSIELRKRNAERIKANIEPDGSTMAARSGDRWKMRSLKAGQTLKKNQKFNFFKERDLSLAYVIDPEKIIGRENGIGNPPYRASGFLREHIYFKASTGKKLKMFQKMARTKYLRSRNTANDAVIGFLGGITAKIAAEHHYGDSTKKLPARELIGFSGEDLNYIKTEILSAISKGWA